MLRLHGHSISVVGAGIVFILIALKSAPVRAARPDYPEIRTVNISEPVRIVRDFNLSQLKAIKEKADPSMARPLYGFYIHALKIKLETIKGKPFLYIGLVDRKIEVARDLDGGQCLFDNVVTHYRKHADAAENLLEQETADISRHFAIAWKQNPTSAVGHQGSLIIRDELNAFARKQRLLERHIDSREELDGLYKSDCHV
ncbi:hypothetical protein HLH26_11800 [Gluconacetobacter sp. 1b LMG 1731]|uniref:Uncharacterized protein n=1 Tax=Gluconacetobacter dulcium TaxID=2729096 RepID=A0A7W4ILQ2_9PROT|nr:hypothetical protein [Gluconacetobacter dulcium]MBB2165205.1 hypothetical protein [Gluconacetobacter dulcium]MBB2194386.1 hypothetical protein [Gluconacetobacter dulcium]